MGIPVVLDYRELVGKVDGVIVAVPTELHSEVAGWFLRHRIPVLVEKPIADTLESARELVELAQEHDTPLQVGHVERFNPAWRAARRWWQDQVSGPPDRIEALRLSPPPQRDLGVGVILDMMIHDLDLILSILPEQPAIPWVETLTLDESKEEDLCIARLQWPGAVASVTAARIAYRRVRQLKVSQGSITMKVDLLDPRVTVTRDGESWEELVVESGWPLEYQLEEFLQVIAGGPCQVSGAEALKSLELAYAITEQGAKITKGN